MTSTDELETLLEDWGAAARAAGENPLAPAHQRARGRSRRWESYLAAGIAACVVAGLAITFVFASSPHKRVQPTVGTATSPHPVTSAPVLPCARNFAVSNVTAVAAEAHYSISLKYLGSAPCSVRASTPGFVLLGITTRFQGSNPQRAHEVVGPMVTVRPGEVVTFTLDNLRMCVATPSGEYRVIVDLDSPYPPTPGTGISVPIGHLDPNGLLCITNGIGDISPISVGH